MKKLLLSILVLGAFSANAQTTIFAENWDGVGPGVAGWTLYNVDGRTPVGPEGTAGEALSFLIQDAWNVLSLSDIQGANSEFLEYPAAATGMANNIIASNSWYTPIGVANDWLVSPLITVPTGATNITLTWAATSLGSEQFLEDYRVLLSPTGGNAVANFTNLLIDVNNELSSGNFRTQILNNNLAGTSFRIAFQNDGNDQYVMFLDNIRVSANLPLSNGDFFSSKFSIYPNPANNVVSISNFDNIMLNEIIITDVNGRIVVKNKYSNVSQTEVNVSELTSGVYFMNIDTDSGRATKKFIKN
ncbi:T9SS type A sorting domain-containing protein [Flavobacterium sp. j3]|uniref:T9SS type A sorting domain-containing protein n=1 Tax=Flavobacterium aureirubrum TaxID=3133147 RepID=A0ABU9N0Y1_9FLAO